MDRVELKQLIDEITKENSPLALTAHLNKEFSVLINDDFVLKFKKTSTKNQVRVYFFAKKEDYTIKRLGEDSRYA